MQPETGCACGRCMDCVRPRVVLAARSLRAWYEEDQERLQAGRTSAAECEALADWLAWRWAELEGVAAGYGISLAEVDQGLHPDGAPSALVLRVLAGRAVVS